MARKILIRKIYSTGTDYETGAGEVLVIQKIGTDATSKVTVNVEGAPVCETISYLGDIYKDTDRFLDYRDLGNKFVVVPPQRSFNFAIASGSARVAVVGYALRLSPGEAMPSELASRYNNQTKDYATFVNESVSKAEGETIAANEEVTIFTKQADANETLTFDGLVEAYAEAGGSALTYSNWALKFYVNDYPLDFSLTDAGKKGIVFTMCPRPPKTGWNLVPFTLKENPIVLNPGDTLKCVIVNISGSDYTAPSGGFTAYATLEMKRVIK